MATTYTSTIEINVWKEHTCVGCGGAFRYLFKRKKSGTGGSPAAAQANARKAVVNALAHEVDMQPCPGCGLYQPDMIGAVRARRHWWVFAFTLAALLALLILALTEVLAYSTAAWVAAGVAFFVLLTHLLLDAGNPNRDLGANHRLAQARVESGDLWVPRGSNANPTDVEALAGGGWSPAHTVAYALLGLGLLAFVFPEGLRLVRGWPQNKAWFPVVAGPGEEVYTYFPDKITSVGGHWKGNAVARVLNAGELGLPPTLKATSKSDDWGNKISVDSKSKTSTNAAWAKVQLPTGPDLAGKTLQLELHLAVRYPQLQGDKQFQAVETAFRHTAKFRLSTPRAGARYLSWWWGGMTTGALLLVISGVLVARLSAALRQKALPTDIFVPGQDEQPRDEGAQAAQEGVRPPEAEPAPPPAPDDRVRE